MAMKKWTIETLVSQLRTHLLDATGEDIMEDGQNDLLNLSLGDIIDVLKDHSFRERLIQVPGQTSIIEAIAEVNGDDGDEGDG